MAAERRSLPAVVLAVALAGCDGRAGYVAEPVARLEAARAACGPELDPRRFVEQAVTGGCRIEPGAAARASDRITVAEIAGRTGSTFVVRLDDASDDSIRAEEHRIELARGAGGWRIVWAGHRWACWPGRGHEGFGTAPCS